MSDRERVEALAKVLRDHTLSRHGTTFGGFTPCRCSCGVDFSCPIFQSWEMCDHYHRAHVASTLAALLDRVRREEGERIAQAIEAGVLPSHPNEGYKDGFRRAAQIARAASVGRGDA